jgi:hypothetical protein
VADRFQIAWAGASGFAALVVCSALAFAQAPNVECRKTETQAECFARLKCKPNEELEACQKRLRDAANDERTGREREGDGQRSSRDRGGNDSERDRGDSDRGRDERSGRDNSDRGGDDRDDGDSSRGRRGGGGGGRGGSRRSGGGGSSFEANKTFGLGLELGEPTGLNGKLFLSPAGALDFGVGWIYRHYYYGDGFHLYADYLWHPVSLVHAAAFELPLYIGVGLRYWEFDYCDMRVCTYNGSAMGIRIPVGITFDFNHVPLDIFTQLVPVVDFVYGDYYDRYRDREHFGIDLSVGIRYWFK